MMQSRYLQASSRTEGVLTFYSLFVLVVPSRCSSDIFKAIIVSLCRANSIKFYERHRSLTMHGSDVLVNVGGLLAAEVAVRALVSGRFAALVSVVSEHGVSSAVAVVAIGTVILAGVRVEPQIPYLHVFTDVVKRSVTYKRSSHGQHRSKTLVCCVSEIFRRR